MSDKSAPEEMDVEEDFASDEVEDPDNEDSDAAEPEEDSDAAEPEEDSDAAEPQEDNEMTEGTNCLLNRVCVQSRYRQKVPR